MAMTKAEMERHRAEYLRYAALAGSAVEEGAYREAVERAVSSWDYVDGMIQYERKYGGVESVHVESIEIALTYAPLLFDSQSLDKLDAILKNQRRIVKNASGDVAGNALKARSLMREAHALWHYLDAHPECLIEDLCNSLGGEQVRWRSIGETWARMGVVRHTPEGSSYRLALYTRLNDVVLGKCPECGVTGKAPKEKLVEERHCPRCREKVIFVLLAKAPRTQT